ELDRFLSVSGAPDVISRGSDDDPNDLHQIGVIVDDQHVCGTVGHLAPSGEIGIRIWKVVSAPFACSVMVPPWASTILAVTKRPAPMSSKSVSRSQTSLCRYDTSICASAPDRVRFIAIAPCSCDERSAA